MGGINGTTIATLAYGNTLMSAGAIQVTKSGLIAILDQLVPAIDTYKPPQGGSLGNPVAITPLQNCGSISTAFAFTPPNNLLLASGGNGVGESCVWKYPAGGSPLQSVQGGPQSGAFGVAINPPEIP